jgi:hypothetical protein
MNKKTFIAATIITALLISTGAGVQVNLAKANFMPFPPSPIADPPIVDVVSTGNMEGKLNFTLTKPETWKWNVDVRSIRYSVDGQQGSIEVGRRMVSYGGLSQTLDNLAKTSEYTISLSGLKNGQHIIWINVTVVSYFNPPNDYWIVHEYPMIVSKAVLLTTTSSPSSEVFSNITSVSEIVYPDKYPPIISLFLAHKGTYGLIIPLSFSVNEPAAWVGFSIDNGSNVTITGNTTLPKLVDGNHSIVLYANDIAGNTGVSERINFTVDTVIPLISNLSIENKVYNSTNIPLSFSINKIISQISYCLDNQRNVTIVGNATLTGLTDGLHSLVVYANDGAGNVGKSDTVFFTVSNPTPSPTQQPTLEPSLTLDNIQTGNFTPLIIIFGLMIVAVMLGVLFYFKKIKK